MHQRKLIRHAITAALLDVTAAKKRVFPTRKINHQLAELPVIAVYSLNEDSEMPISPRELERTLTVLIEAFVESIEDVDDLMDDLAFEIEAGMDQDYTFGGVCYESMLVSTDLESVEDSDRQIGILEMTYTVMYRTEAYPECSTDPADAPDDLGEYDRSTTAIDLEGEQDLDDQTLGEFEQE